MNEEEVSEVKWFARKDLDRLLNSKREDFSPAFALVWTMARDSGFLESGTN